jgi:hypothetical protein
LRQDHLAEFVGGRVAAGAEYVGYFHSVVMLDFGIGD